MHSSRGGGTVGLDGTPPLARSVQMFGGVGMEQNTFEHISDDREHAQNLLSLSWPPPLFSDE